MSRSLLVAALAVIAASLPARTQSPPFASHDLLALPFVQLNPVLRVRTVVGEVGSFAIGEYAAGPPRNPHHHTYEQINVGLSGTSGIRMAGQLLELGALGATLAPNDVEHVLENTGRQSTLLEFQPVRRFDLLPERRPVTLPVGPTAVPVPAAWPLHTDFSSASTGWEALGSGVRRKAVKGHRAAMAVWRIPGSATTDFDLSLQLPGAEQFIYVVEGRAQFSRGTYRAEGSPDVLVVSGPNAPPVRARSTGQPAVVLVLEAIASELQP